MMHKIAGGTLVKSVVFGHRAEIRHDEIERLASAYGPGEVLRLKDVGGTYNLNVLLEMRDKMYIVRVYRPWITYERLAFLHAVKEALARSGLPVALPLATNTGETMLTYRNSDRNQDDERLAEIEPFIPHDHVADDWPR